MPFDKSVTFLGDNSIVYVKTTMKDHIYIYFCWEGFAKWYSFMFQKPNENILVVSYDTFCTQK